MVDRVGRRIPLLAGSMGLSICLFYIGGYVSLKMYDTYLTLAQLINLQLTAVGPREGGATRTAGDYTAIVCVLFSHCSLAPAKASNS